MVHHITIRPYDNKSYACALAKLWSKKAKEDKAIVVIVATQKGMRQLHEVIENHVKHSKHGMCHPTRKIKKVSIYCCKPYYARMAAPRLFTTCAI